MRVLVDGSWDGDLRLVDNRLLDDRLLNAELLSHGLLLDDGMALQVNIGTHRRHVVGLTLSVVTGMVSMDVGAVGGVGHLRLEVDARVGRLDVTRHGDGSSDWVGDVGVLRIAVGIRLSRVVGGEVGRLSERLLQVSGVVNENRVASSGNGIEVVVGNNSRNSWALIGGGVFGWLGLLTLSLIHI